MIEVFTWPYMPMTCLNIAGVSLLKVYWHLRGCALEKYVQISEKILDVCTYLKGKICVEVLKMFRYYRYLPRYLNLIVYFEISKK